MIKKLFLSQAARAKTGFWLLNQDRFAKLFFYLLILFLPTQLGKHFWPKFSFVFGLRLDYLSPTLYLTDVFILFIFFFSFKKTIGEFKKINKKYKIVFFLFILTLATGLVGSINIPAGVYAVIKVLEFSFLVFYVSFTFEKLNKKIIFILISASLLFESSLSFLQYLNNGSLGGIFYFFGERAYGSQTPGIANASINGQLFLRPYATFSHPNVLAAFLLISIFYLSYFIKKIKINKKFFLLIFITACISILLTLSRGVIFILLTFVFYLFGLFLYEKFKKGELKSIFVSSFIVLIFLFLTFYFFANSEVLQRFFSLNLADESIKDRGELIAQSLKMFSSHPIFGVGINNFYQNLEQVFRAKIILIQPVHNIFLLVASQTGIVGVAFFACLFYKVFQKISEIKIEGKKYLLFIGLSIFTLGLFDHYFLTIQQGQLLFSLFLGIVFSYKKNKSF